ncbi:hypothetical protein M0R04_03310 [Candidatus Dojkabacteria bacterium]|jgi:hypothetical protein|nr:hypothetical protein [Candidatus Dojkabacteria bacterium]
MAQYRLTKKAIILLVVLFLLIGGGAGGYIWWRVNQNKTIAPTGADAGGGGNSCCDPSIGCVTGYTCKTSQHCSASEGPSTSFYGESCGKNSSGATVKCRSFFECNVASSAKNGYSGSCSPKDDSSTGTCVKSDVDDDSTNNCNSWIADNRTSCEWPKVLMSGRATAGQELCRCEKCTGKVTSNPYSCSGNPPTDASLGDCPDGETSCGDSTQHESGSSCTRQDSIYDTVYHPDCGNPSYIYRYCKPETVVENTCETGGITTPVASASYEVGDVVHIKGWAADADGINVSKVAVKVNGVTVGNATVHTACAPDNADATICTAQTAAKKPIIWTYDYTVTTAGTKTFNISWEDTKGLTGTNCAVTRAITADVTGNPDWEMSKTGTNVCIDQTAGSMEARVDYVITVTNTGTAEGTLTQIEDTLDTKVHESYIQDSTVTPSAVVSGNSITWALSGAGATFAPSTSKEYSYSIIVPESAFGQYSNTVVGTPSAGDTFSSSEVTYATCEDVPDTGLFDSIVAKVVLGIGLIFVGVIYLSSGNSIFNKISLVVNDGGKVVLSGKARAEVKKRKFENRVAGK